MSQSNIRASAGNVAALRHETQLGRVLIKREGGTSAITLKADIRRQHFEVRYVPKADVPLFDHFVGARQQRHWRIETEGLGGLEIDHKFKLRRVLHW